MIVHVKSRWNIIHFKVSPFDMSNVSPYLKQTLKFQFPHFVSGTTLYICKSALPFWLDIFISLNKVYCHVYCFM